MTEKKLVQAFRAFVQKSVIPLNTTNDVLLNDWKHFNNIISSDPIDPNQLDFYLYVINKQPNNSPALNKTPPERQTTGNISEFGKFSKRGNQFTGGFGMQGNSQVNNPMIVSSNFFINIKDDKGSNSLLNQKKQPSTMTNSTTSASRSKSSSGIKETTSGFNTSITSNGGTKKYY